MSYGVVCNRGWPSARRLAAALDAVVITGRPAARAGRTLINYGRSDVLHRPDVVNHLSSAATDKLACLHALSTAGVPTIGFFTEPALRPEGKTIYARTLTRAKKGAGIVIVEPAQELPAAPLYTVRYPNTYEYRVHVCCGQSIHVQRRVKRPDT